MTSVAAISAQDFSVSGNFTNLNNEISHSSANDVINVEGNITLQDSESQSYKNGITIDHNLEIDGKGHTIDGKSANGNRNSIFTIKSNAKVIIKDLVIMNAYGESQGGAISLESGSLTLINCTFIANGANNKGGAIYANGALTVNGCNFEKNTITFGTAYGGAIYSQNSNLKVNNTNFSNNRCINTADSNTDASNGGAISCQNGKSIQIDNCNFINNSAHGTRKSTAVGGAFQANTCELVNITNCNFTNNSVSCDRLDSSRGISRGGAISIYDDKNKNYLQFITNCRFVGNNAEDAAGALRSTGLLTISNSYFAQNYLTKPDQDDKMGLNGTFGTAIANDRGGNLHIINTIIENHNATINNSYGTVFYHDKADIIFENVTMRNNYAGYGGAIYNYNGEESTFNITGSRFINNTAIHGGAIFNAGQVLKINNTDFINNTALDEGGVISSEEINRTSSTAILELNNTRFINSTAATNGGVVYANQGSPIFILNSYFTNSTANAGGAIYSKNNKNIIIDNTTFVNNNATTQGGAIIASNGSTINCSVSTFNDNKAHVGGGISASSNSEVNLIVCAFNNNTAALNGGAIYANESSVINVVNSTFKDNNATNYGGAIAASTRVLVNMSNAVFENNTALRGGAVYENTDSSFIGVNSTFVSNHATEYGGAIDASSNVGIYLYNSTFASNGVEDDGGAIYANAGSKIHIENTNFTNNSANGAGKNSTGGAISGYENAIIDIFNSKFENNSAEYGGAIAGDYNSVIGVTNSNFTKNSASVLGGAISAPKNVRFNITNSTFDKNTAAKGGAISGDYNSRIYVTGSEFTNNSASTDGGAIAGLENVQIIVSNSAFDENAAVNGGAISGDNGSIINITESGFKSNNATQNGGAISGAQVIISYSNLTENEAGENGGAIYSSANSYVGYNNFNNNSATNNESAIYSAGDKTIVKNIIREEDVEGFSSIYLTNDEYNRNANLTQNTIATNLIPIYNNGNFIVSPTKLVVINNDSYVVSVNENQDIWAHLYDDNNNTIGSSSDVTVTVWNADKTFDAEFDESSMDFISATQFKVESIGQFPVTGIYNNAESKNQTVLNGLISTAKIPTDVIINIPDCKYNQTIRGNVSLTNQYGFNISGSVTVVIDENITLTVPIYDGLGYIEVNDSLAIGNHSATVKFEGDDAFLASENETSFDVTKWDTKATITVPDIVEGENITGTITLVDEYRKNLTGNVTVIIADLSPFVVEVVNGTGKFNLSETLNAGIGYNAHVDFNGTEIYNPCGESTKFDVEARNKTNTIVTISVPNIVEGENVTGSVTLKDVNGTDLSGNVTVTVADWPSFVVEVVNGTGNFNLNGTLPADDDYHAQVEFNGDALYNPSLNTSSFNVGTRPRIDTNVTISVPDIVEGENVTGSVTLKDAEGNNLSGNVTVKINDHTIIVEVVNGTGNFTLNETLPADDDYYAQVDFYGNESYNPSTNSTSFNVNSESKMDTVVTVEVPDHNVGQEVNGTVTLTDKDGNKLSANVEVTIGSETVTVTVIDGTGIFDVKNQTAGSHDVSVKFAGNAKYNPSNDENTFDVSKVDTKVTVHVPDHRINETVNGTVTLTDKDGNPINGTVNVTIGEWTKDIEVVDGKGTFEFSDQKSGQNNVTASFAGDEKYNPSKNNDSFIVSKLPTPLYIEYEKDGNDVILIVKIPDYRNETVKITIDNPNYKKEFIVEVINGTGTVTVGRLPEGDYNVAVIYDENEIYLGNETEIILTISDGKGTNGDAYSANAYSEAMAMDNGLNDLKTGNPMVLLLLALFVIPIRRILKK